MFIDRNAFMSTNSFHNSTCVHAELLHKQGREHIFFVRLRARHEAKYRMEHIITMCSINNKAFDVCVNTDAFPLQQRKEKGQQVHNNIISGAVYK